MAHIYTNRSSGQVVSSDEPLAHLEGVARWEHTEGDAPKKAVEIPEGKPSEDWTGDQLKAYAEKHELTLGSAKNKAEIVKAIEDAEAAKANDGGTPAS